MLDRWYGASLDALEISFSKPQKIFCSLPWQTTTHANAFESLLENLDCFSFLMFLLKDRTLVCLFVIMPKWPKTQESGYWRRPNNQANWKGTLLRQGIWSPLNPKKTKRNLQAPPSSQWYRYIERNQIQCKDSDDNMRRVSLSQRTGVK